METKRGSVVVFPARDWRGGVVEAPPSKSYTHRAVFASIYAGGVTVVENPLISSDTLATVSLARALGARVRVSRDGLAVSSPGPRVRRPWCYCRGSGTTLRLGMGAAAAGDRAIVLYGNGSLNRRPVAPLSRALRGLGVGVVDSNGTPPVAVRGPVRENVEEAVVDGGVSSQFVSSLLMLGGLHGFRVRVRGRMRSRPYVDMTRFVMERFGVEVSVEDVGGGVVFVPRGRYSSPGSYRVPGDYSSAAFLLAAGALLGGVEVQGLDPGDVQGDRRVVEYLGRMGVKLGFQGDAISVQRAGTLEALDADMGDTPDLVPVFSVLAAFARGVTRIRGVGHLRYKESDRLENIVDNLARLGVEARVEGGETLVIRGRGGLGAGRVESRCDHRIVMSFAVGALAASGPVEISCPESVAESYPSFFQVLEDLGARLEWER